MYQISLNLDEKCSRGISYSSQIVFSSPCITPVSLVQYVRCKCLTLHQEGHRFGPPSAHIFMFVIFSVVRVSLALCVSTLTKQAIKRKLPAKLWPRGDKNL